MNRNEFQEITIPLRAGNVCGRWYGNQQERPILALHGWGDNAGTFARLAPLIANQIPILAIDLPGHGLSEAHPHGIKYHILDFVRTVRAIMIYYKWPKLSLMGHSMGTGVSYLTAALFPGSVDIILSIDGFGLLTHKLEDQMKLLKYATEGYLQTSEKIMDSQKKNKPEPSYTFEQWENMVYKATGKSVDMENAKYLLERKLKSLPNEREKFYLSEDRCTKYMEQIFYSLEFRDALTSSIKDLKWLVLKSETSTVINHKQTVHVVEVLDDKSVYVEYYDFPNTTHHLHLNNPELVASYINRFLTTNRAAELIQVKGRL